MALADGQAEQFADATAADRADNGRGAHVDFEAKQEIAHEIRHDLRHHAEPNPLQPVGAHRLQALIGLHVGVLHHFEEHLAKRADGVDRHGHDGRDRAERENREKEAGNDHFRKGAQDFHEATGDAAYPGVRDHVLGGNECQAETED
ncbi:hypothetical protein D3C87_1659090 [compost metagenome]